MTKQQVQDEVQRHLSFLSQDENNLNLLVEISNLYLKLEDLESANMYLDKASAINRESCLGHQGFLFLRLGNFAQAKECFLEALNYADTPALRYNLGFALYFNCEFEEASKAISPILNGEYTPQAELLMARILHRQDSIEEAIHLVESILEQNPLDSEVLGLLSLLYFDINAEDAARETSIKALELNPENYEARLVKVLTRLNIDDTSVAEIDELLLIAPHDCRLWFALGNNYMLAGDFVVAEDTFVTALNLYPEFYDCIVVLAWCQLLNDKVNESAETFQKAAALAEDLADAWGGLSVIAVLKKDFLKAKKLINKAKNLNPECFLTNVAKLIYFTYKNPQQAQSHLSEVLNNDNISLGNKLAFFIV